MVVLFYGETGFLDLNRGLLRVLRKVDDTAVVLCSTPAFQMLDGSQDLELQVGDNIWRNSNSSTRIL